MCPFCISTLHSEIEKRTPREGYGSASANGLPKRARATRGLRATNQMKGAPMAEDDRRESLESAGRGRCTSSRPGSVNPLVELLVVDSTREMLAAEDVPDRLALRVADPKLPVSRPRTTAVIRHG